MLRKCLAAIITVAVAGSAVPKAHAGFYVSLNEAGAGPLVLDLNNANTVSQYFNVVQRAGGITEYDLKTSIIVGDYSFFGSFIKTNNPGLQSGAKLSVGNSSLTRVGDQYGDPLTISVTQTDFTRPSGPGSSVALTGSGDFTYAPNATATLSATVDLGNNAFATGGDPSQVYTASTVLSPVASGTLTPVSQGNFSIGGNFSLTTSMTVSGLGVGDSVQNLGANGAVYAPAPGGLILAATAVPFFGLLRRRLRTAAGAAV